MRAHPWSGEAHGSRRMLQRRAHDAEARQEARPEHRQRHVVLHPRLHQRLRQPAGEDEPLIPEGDLVEVEDGEGARLAEHHGHDQERDPARAQREQAEQRFIPARAGNTRGGSLTQGVMMGSPALWLWIYYVVAAGQAG